MSYKPPRPEEKTGRSAVGLHQRGVPITVFKVLLGITVSATLLALFLASAALAWVVLFTGPTMEVRASGDGSVTIVVPGDHAARVTRVRLAGRDGRVIWEFAAPAGTMTLPALRLTVGANPADPGLGASATIVQPDAGSTFALDAALDYAVTIWGPNEAGGRGSSTRWFTLADVRGS